MSDGDVKIVVTLDSTGAQAKIETFDKALRDLQGQTGQNRTAAKSFGEQLTTGLIPSFTAASLAADGIKKTFAFAKNQVDESVQAAIEAERANRALESTLEIVGEAAGGNAQRLKDYADALMSQTVYDDEAIKGAEALIIQMRGTSDGIETATRGAIALASVFQMDLQSAAKIAAQGFEGNYRQLGMLIPAVRNATTEGQKYAAMVDFLKGAYKRALDEANTFGGQLTTLKRSYKELQETMGGFITKNQAVIDTLAGIRVLTDGLNQSIGGKLNFFEILRGQAVKLPPGLRIIAEYLQMVGWAARSTKPDLEGLVDPIGSVAIELLSTHKAARDLMATWPSFKQAAIEAPVLIIKTGDAAKDAAADFQTLEDRYAMLDDDLRKLRALSGNFNIFTPVSNQLGSLGDMIGGATGQVVDFTEKVPDLFEGLKTGAAEAKDVESVWTKAFGNMLGAAVQWGDGSGDIFKAVGTSFAKLTESIVTGYEAQAIAAIASAVKIGKAAEAKSIAEWVAGAFSKLGIFGLPLALAGFAVVNSVFAKILKFDQGGFADKPTLAVVGHGPEYMLPERKLERLIERTVIETRGGGGRGGGPQVFSPIVNIHVSERLDRQEIRRLGPEILQSIKDAASGTAFSWGRA